MKKTIKVIEQETFCFEKPEEVKLLKELINYCWHRASKHETPMTKYIDKISELRDEIGITNKRKTTVSSDELINSLFGIK